MNTCTLKRINGSAALYFRGFCPCSTPTGVAVGRAEEDKAVADETPVEDITRFAVHHGVFDSRQQRKKEVAMIPPRWCV
jgi:hypothetical protein